ncbi:MAG: rod shape-determining protein MreC, partial [Chloroflexota bacterium]|nr:rod shape-determining protein MreC [Chloroflexota bacterium]
LVLDNVRLREQAVAAQQAAKLDAVARGLPFESVPAQVIARDPSGVRSAIVLSAGSDQGVKPGHIVVGDTGAVGRVSEVGTNFSKVLLVTDSGSTVSALAQGSRASGIVRGQYGDTLLMDWVLQSDPVKVGDVVITAGLALGADLRSYYPKGLVIGAVTAVEKADNAAYQRAVVAPAVDLRHLESALVVKTY